MNAINKYLVITTFISGAIVMVIELLGSRVIGPPFGVSLFVWTSLITVTLVSLALGYWLGGKAAEKRPTASYLYSIIIISGLYLIMVPLIKSFINGHALALGLRLGSLASSAVLFGPPLFLLGMVTPYVVKLYMADRIDGVGRTVGWLYAVSTAGSFIGTVSTGFILIPNIGVSNILYLSALALIIIGAAYFAFFKRRFIVLILIIAPIVAAFIPVRPPEIHRPDGTLVKIIHIEDTAYGQIKAVEYSYGDMAIRELQLDNIVQSGIFVNSGVSVFEYTYNLAMLADRYVNNAKRALVIGLGAGIVPDVLSKYYGIKTDVVEINGRVVDAAEKYFLFNRQAHNVTIEDGRYFLRKSHGRYDVVVADAFNGDTTPGHLISVEAFDLIKKSMTPEGALLINFVGGTRNDDPTVITSLYGTLKKEFKNVDVYATKNYFSNSKTAVNITYVATDKDVTIDKREELEPKAPVYPLITENLKGLAQKRIELDPGPFIFTDNFNPMDYHDAEIRERFRASSIAAGDLPIVLY